MSKVNLPNRKTPCKDCPFRKDCLKGWLGGSRIEEILQNDSFVCHKNHELQCAGHMIIKGNSNVFVRTASAMNLDTELKNKHLIFENENDCVKHHKIKQ